MSSHTPGPWDVEGPEDDPFHHCICTIGNGYAVVATEANPDQYHEGADAQLIAAAPDMLEALQKCIHVLPLSEECDLAVSVIAKAKGEME